MCCFSEPFLQLSLFQGWFSTLEELLLEGFGGDGIWTKLYCYQLDFIYELLETLLSLLGRLKLVPQTVPAQVLLEVLTDPLFKLVHCLDWCFKPTINLFKLA